MRRVLVVALGLALAGCAQGPPARPGTIPALGPVGFSPIPPLNQAVNGGMAFQNSALSWPGGTAPSGAESARRVTATTNPALPPVPIDPKAVVAAATAPPAAAANSPSSPPAAPMADSPRPIEEPTGPQPLPSAPDSTPEPTTPAPEAGPASPNPEPTTPAAEPDTPAPGPAAPAEEPALPPSEPATMPTEPAAPKPGPAELPPLPDPPGNTPAAPGEPPPADEGKPAPANPDEPPLPAPEAPAPAPPETRPEPAESPAPEPAPKADDSAPAPALPPDPAPSGKAMAPAGAEPAVTAPADSDPASGPAVTAPAAETETEHDKPLADGPAAASVPGPVDPAVRTVAASAADVEADRLKQAKVLPRLPERELLGQTVARIGDEEITLQQLATIYAFENNGQVVSEEVKQQRLSQILSGMIETRMLVQAAKRRIKQPQAWDMINRQIDAEWREHELPKYLKRYNAANEVEVKKKLADLGYSLDELYSNFRQELIARDFMHAEIAPKFKVDYRELRAFYEANKSKFDRPAQVTWREIVVEVGKHKTRAEAKSKAAEALAQLRKGEDFAKVARALSEGPKAKQGGLWVTSPGSYSAAGINAALDRLPIGQVSTILEEPESFHIVRVEERRAAGPAGFDEVQDEIEDTLRQQKGNKAMRALIAKLRAGTPISRLDEPAPEDGKGR